jgi:hypothetical protein
LPRLGERIIGLHDSIRSVIIFNDDSMLVDSACRERAISPFETDGPLHDGTGPPRPERVLFEISRMISSALGHSGRVVFHSTERRLLGLRVGGFHVILDIAHDGPFGEIAAKVREIARN